MSTADEPSPGRREPENRPVRPTRSPKQARALIIGAVVAGIVLVVGFMLLVSRCGSGDDGEVDGSGAAPAARSVVLSAMQ